MQDDEEFAGEAAPPTGEGEARHVPLAAMLSERERRRAAERELEALRARSAEADPFEALNARLNRSEAEARARHGGAAVEAAQAWTHRRMAEDEAFARTVMAHPDPYDFAIERHKAEEAAPRAHELVLQHRNEQPDVPLVEPAPRSLVSAPSAGGSAHVPIGPGQAFDALFNRQ